jgi:tetratricopeptide (TPR) repeat protein
VHLANGEIFLAQKRFDEANAEYEHAIANNRNLAAACALIGLTKVFIGRAQDAFLPIERAIRLSPRDPLLASAIESTR